MHNIYFIFSISLNDGILEMLIHINLFNIYQIIKFKTAFSITYLINFLLKLVLTRFDIYTP